MILSIKALICIIILMEENMKKFYWLLFFLTLFMGSTTKANTIVNKSDKVIKILEDNLSSFYKENANKQALFCGDIDSILEGDREGLYSFYLRKCALSKASVALHVVVSMF